VGPLRSEDAAALVCDALTREWGNRPGFGTQPAGLLPCQLAKYAPHHMSGLSAACYAQSRRHWTAGRTWTPCSCATRCRRAAGCWGECAARCKLRF
jgi:hypothetical protein